MYSIEPPQRPQTQANEPAPVARATQEGGNGVRRRGPFQDALQPGDLTHHVLLRDLSLDSFPWTVRELRRRLYEGRVTGNATSQRIALRQGFPLWWSATLFALGWFLLAGFMVTGSDLGRSFQLLNGSGGTAQAAAPVLLHPWHTADPIVSPLLLLGSGIGLLAISFLLSLCPRRHVFLVAQRNAANRIDLWVAGTSWRHERRFDREFADLTQRIGRMHRPDAS